MEVEQVSRIRTIKPEILDDEKAAALSDKAWRLWVSTWVIADDHGRFHAHPLRLHSKIFWARESPENPRESQETLDGTRAALEELNSIGLIRMYRVKGETYAEISGWKAHQRVDKPSKPRFPRPEDGEIVLAKSSLARVQEFPENPRDDLRPPTSDLRPLDQSSSARARDRAAYDGLTDLGERWNDVDGFVECLDVERYRSQWNAIEIHLNQRGISHEDAVSTFLENAKASDIVRGQAGDKPHKWPLRHLLRLDRFMAVLNGEWSSERGDVLEQPYKGGGSGLRARADAMRQERERDALTIETTAVVVDQLGDGGSE